jgi:transcription-repair coupling factor (superfamily II helicase)
VKNIFKLIHKDKQYKQIAGDLVSGKDCHVQGLWGSSASFLIAGLANDGKLSRKGEILFVTSGIDEAEEIFEDINVFLPAALSFFQSQRMQSLQSYNLTIALMYNRLMFYISC